MAIKTVSKKQSTKNRKLAMIKKELFEVAPFCVICRRSGVLLDLMHLLPKGRFPEHYTNRKNLVLGCRECHTLFDDNREFRKQQTKLIEQVEAFDELGANQYFDL